MQVISERRAPCSRPNPSHRNSAIVDCDRMSRGIGRRHQAVIEPATAIVFDADPFSPARQVYTRLVGPPCRLTMASKRRCNKLGRLELLAECRISSKSGLPSKQPANRVSTSTEMRKPGNSSLSARTGLVNSRQSPIERRRTKRIRAFGGRR